MADKRQQIEAAATDAIKKGGLSSVSFRTLADEVGVKSSSVHYHFPTKADLAEAVVRGYTDDFNGVLSNILREERNLRPRLYRLIEVFDDVNARDELCLCGAIAADAVSLDDATRRALRTFFRVTEAWLEALLDEAQDELRTELESAHIARVLMAGLEGAGLVDRAVGGTDHLEAYRRLVDSFTTGG